MPDPNTEHGLRVQLATALRERDAEKAARWELEKERGEVNAALKAEMAEAEKLRAEVKRLRKELEDIAAWNDDQIALIQKEKDRIEDPKGYLHQWEMAHKIAAHDARAALCTGGDRG